MDFFTPITDDPYEFGSVAAANSLSDVYAMGGRPLVALNVVGFPAALAVEMLGDVLRGGYDKAAEANCLIVGGHTVDDNEPKYGLSVVGLVEPGKQVSNAGARPGDVLVLTKPLGTGIVTTGCKAGVAPPGSVETAVETMATLNRAASEAMMEVGVNACTDVTGFGLMGHLTGMLRASGVSADGLALQRPRSSQASTNCWPKGSPQAAPTATRRVWRLMSTGTTRSPTTTASFSAMHRPPVAC